MPPSARTHEPAPHDQQATSEAALLHDPNAGSLSSLLKDATATGPFTYAQFERLMQDLSDHAPTFARAADPKP
jgi:hypothetical protein